MGKNKLQRWAEMEAFPNVIQPQLNQVLNTDYSLKGKWCSDHFKNHNPIVLELGCGKGEYTVGLAKSNSDINYIGIDIKGARLWRGAKQALNENLNNAAFLRTRIEFIKSFFAPGEVDEIWLTFPDPQLKRRRKNKRLSSALFLNSYLSFLKPNGVIHLKTDCYELFQYTVKLLEYNQAEILEATDDLYGPECKDDILLLKTYYEQKFLEKGTKITYLKFRVSKNLVEIG